MGIYHSYTLTNKRGAVAVWKCSKCGKVNIGVGVVSASSSYNDKGAFTSMGVQKRADAAKDALKNNMAQAYANAFQKTRSGDYSEFDLSQCKCEGCGNAEPWSIGKKSISYIIAGKLASICGTLAIMMTMLFLYFLTDNFFAGGLLYVDLAVAGIALAGFIASKVIIKEQIKQTLSLPKESKAQMFIDIPSMKERCDLFTEEEKASL